MTLDEFHYHEARDRLLTVQIMINELLLDHPAVIAHDRLQHKILCADALLADAYQECGRIQQEREGEAE